MSEKDKDIASENQAYDIDLDSIVPQGKKVKLNNKVLTIFPPSVEDFIKLTQFKARLENVSTETEGYAMIDELKECIGRFTPDLKEEGAFNLSFSHLMAILAIAMKMAQPSDGEVMKALGFNPAPSNEQEQKKTESGLVS